MTVLSLNQNGEYHITIRLKGPEDRIQLFHKVMTKCDPEWPWKSTVISQYVCKKCAGLTIHSPRVTPHDIKVAAKQVGHLKVKIYNFGPIKKCKGTNSSYDYANDRQRVTIKEAFELYTSDGRQNFYMKYCNGKHHIPNESRPAVIVPPEPSTKFTSTTTEVESVTSEQTLESTLIDTVLSERDLVETFVPVVTTNQPTPIGSLCQFPQGEEGYDESEGWVM